ncbi:proline-rich protein 2-like [Chroicocephalus ridibundus]|uniref:proline-rich protein 2-like n=1 Tax=Chroicocephalus ridibundus TaxID=1192867 RepID=UPI002FDDE8C5
MLTSKELRTGFSCRRPSTVRHQRADDDIPPPALRPVRRESSAPPGAGGVTVTGRAAHLSLLTLPPSAPPPPDGPQPEASGWGQAAAVGSQPGLSGSGGGRNRRLRWLAETGGQQHRRTWGSRAALRRDPLGRRSGGAGEKRAELAAGAPAAPPLPGSYRAAKRGASPLPFSSRGPCVRQLGTTCVRTAVTSPRRSARRRTASSRAPPSLPPARHVPAPSAGPGARPGPAHSAAPRARGSFSNGRGRGAAPRAPPPPPAAAAFEAPRGSERQSRRRGPAPPPLPPGEAPDRTAPLRSPRRRVPAAPQVTALARGPPAAGTPPALALDGRGAAPAGWAPSGSPVWTEPASAVLRPGRALRIVPAHRRR